MKLKIKVGVSNRHCHLTKEDFNKLFGEEELTYLRPLKQPGQYVSDKMVIIKGEKGQIEKVRVLGPFRNYTQVEVAKSDCYKLGINPPIRKSGDLENASNITIIGPKSEITLPCAIIANRHIHLSKDQADLLGVLDDEPVKINIGGIKQGTIEAFFKVTDEAFTELHLDIDDANAFLLNQDDEVELIIENKRV